MSIDIHDVQKLARLARLQLSADEEAEAVTSLNAILTLIDQLQAADVSQVDELTHLHIGQGSLRLRSPQPQAGIDRDTLLQQAPASDAGYFLTPQVIE